MSYLQNLSRHSTRSARSLTGAGDPTPSDAYDPSGDTVEMVLAWVEDHPDLAATVLAAEVAGKNRKGIVSVLDRPHDEETP